MVDLSGALGTTTNVALFNGLMRLPSETRQSAALGQGDGQMRRACRHLHNIVIG